MSWDWFPVRRSLVGHCLCPISWRLSAAVSRNRRPGRTPYWPPSCRQSQAWSVVRLLPAECNTLHLTCRHWMHTCPSDIRRRHRMRQWYCLDNRPISLTLSLSGAWPVSRFSWWRSRPICWNLRQGRRTVLWNRPRLRCLWLNFRWLWKCPPESCSDCRPCRRLCRCSRKAVTAGWKILSRLPSPL